MTVHHTSNAIVTNNVAYMNGATPLSSGRQSSSGLTWNQGNNGFVANNISMARFDTDAAYAVFECNETDKCQGLDYDTNIVARGTVSGRLPKENFMFVDADF